MADKIKNLGNGFELHVVNKVHSTSYHIFHKGRRIGDLSQSVEWSTEGDHPTSKMMCKFLNHLVTN